MLILLRDFIEQIKSEHDYHFEFANDAERDAFKNTMSRIPRFELGGSGARAMDPIIITEEVCPKESSS